MIGRLNQCGKLHCCLILINYHSCPNPHQPAVISKRQVSLLGNQESDYDSLKVQVMVSIFFLKQYSIFKLRYILFFRHNAIAQLIDYREM